MNTMKIAVVTDSTSYIPQEVIDKLNIYVIPLSVNFGEETYAENVEISTENFYKKLQEEKDLPTTSQPAIGAFIELYEKLERSYDAVISIHISKKLSGTFETAKSAGNMMEKLQVHVYDTEYSAMPQGFHVIRAAELAKEGQDVASILQALNELRENIRAYFMVDDLSHLQRGGRLSGAQALLGSLLNIKPILHIVQGSIVPFEKVRTKKRAIRRIVKMLEDDVQTKRVKRVVFIHGNNEKEALKLRDEFQGKYPNIETMLSYFGPVVGTHLGEGSLGITWYKQ